MQNTGRRDARRRVPHPRLQPLPRRGGRRHATQAASACSAPWATRPRALEIDLTWIDDEVNGRPTASTSCCPIGTRSATTARRSTPRRSASCCRAEQQQFVEEILRRYEVPELPERGRRARSAAINVSEGRVGGLLDVAFGHPIRLVASALGDPPLDLVERAHDAGVLVAALAGTAEHARRSNAKGADLIVAQGTEAGGHTGDDLHDGARARGRRRRAPTPVLAAGGIGRGSQIAAAFALGAEGVWCGSIWLTTAEAETDPAVAAEVPRRDVERHRPVALAHREAGEDAAQRVDRRVGGIERAVDASDARSDDAHRGRAAADQPPRG